MQLLAVSLNAPDAHTDIWHHFSIYQYKKEKHAQGCPLVAEQVIAPQTSEHMWD